MQLQVMLPLLTEDMDPELKPFSKADDVQYLPRGRSHWLCCVALKLTEKRCSVKCKSLKAP